MLTQRTQVQIVADLLAGIDGDHRAPRNLSEPWRTAYQAVANAPAGGAQQALIEALKGLPDRDGIIGAILAAVPGTRLDFPSLKAIADALPPIRWLWPDWIPISMISLLGAAPGVGKSFVGLDLARRIIAGETFPDGAPMSTAGTNIIFVDAEVVPQLLKARAESWQVDMGRLYLMLPGKRGYIDFGEEEDRDHLVEMAYRLEPSLIVVDSVSSITSRGENSIEDIRGILAFLNILAQEAQSALLLIHHLRKRLPMSMTNALTVDDFRGSSHIMAMARSVIGLSMIQTGPEPDRNGPRLLEVVKTNLARYPAPLGIEFRPLHPSGVLLQYGEPPAPYEKPTKISECADWLLQTLEEADGPVRPVDIVDLARQEGFSRATVYRAREMLGESIRDTEGSQNDPTNKWAPA